jgi:Flp pilus assembly pilin Flp
MSILKRFLIEEDGQDMVEYGLVISLVVAAAGGIMLVYTGGLSTAMSGLATAIQNAL